MKKIKAKIVVGCGYGDEGKGLTVDWLCENYKNPVVIRFSGGQQAGHTVCRGGKKHTFSNFGAGTFLDAPTYFSEHTTFYPIGIKYEQLKLQTLGFTPELVIHPMARLTTPWDVFENRACKINLANGSCGQGVGKTMKRNEGPHKLMAIDLSYPNILEAKMLQIEKQFHQRHPGMKSSPHLFKEVSEFNIALREISITIADYSYLKIFKTLIFEGSQGVMLDMDHGVFPNVTYANTTSKNAMEICDKLKIKDRHVFCVSRSYSTRHGKGDGEYEGEPIELKHNENETNVSNAYQGDFLCTKLDYNRLSYALNIEALYSKKYKHALVITCENQVTIPFDLGLLDNNPFTFTNIYRSYTPSAEKLYSDY